MAIPSVSPESVGMSSERLQRIKPAMQGWIDRGVIAGASMMVARRGETVYCEQIGRLDIERDIAMPDDAIFRIYSMTKPIICTALMTFYEEGRFQLRTPAAKFIPALGELKVLRQNAAGETMLEDLTRPITVGDLMKHTAGFTYPFLVDSPVGGMLYNAASDRNPDATLADFALWLAQFPLAFQPGSRWHYSIATDLVAYLIEILADQPLRDVLQTRIFTPLGMADTDFCVPDDKLPRLAAMYGVDDIVTAIIPKMFADWQDGVWGRLDVDHTYPTSHPETFARGGYGLFSTTQDYMRFALMLLNKGELNDRRILGRKTVELMHVNHLPTALLPLEIGGAPIDGYGFGLGSRTMVDVGAAGTPGSVGEFGWSGAATTYYWVDPAEELVGVFMTQYQGMDEPDLDFRVLVYQAIVD